MLRRGKTAAACLIALTCAVAATLPTDGAQAARGSELYGVTTSDPPSAAEFQRMAAGGVRVARILVDWQYIERSPGQRDWAGMDAVFAASAQSRVAVLPMIFGSPSWISQQPARAPVYTPSQRAAFALFVRDLVARYKPGGTYWQSQPQLIPNPPRSWQLWNEPNLPGFWGGKPNARRYGQLLAIASDEIRAADPAAQVVTAGIFPYKTLRRSVPLAKYLPRLLRIKKVRRRVDAIAVHPYGRSPKQVLANLRDARRVINRNGGKRIPMWVTEVGWSTGGVLWKKSPFRATERQQAKRLTATYKLLRKNAKRLRLQRALWFAFRDFDEPGDRDLWITRMGLFDVAGNPKPAWFAYARSAGGQP